MTCAELADEYELYALGALDEPERSELRAHLDRRCETCVPAMSKALMRVSRLSALAPDVEPPKRLRAKILAGVGVEPRSGWGMIPAWAVAAAAAALAVFWIGHTGEERIREQALTGARQQVAEYAAEAGRLREVMTLLGAPETIVRVSVEGAAKPPQGKVFLNPARGVLLIASNLPPAPAGKLYEMWVIPAGGAPVPAGLFQTAADGGGIHFHAGPVDVNATGAVAVTLEAAGGAAQPTSQPIIVAPVSKG